MASHSAHSPRFLAVQALQEVLQNGRSLSDCLPPVLAQIADSRDKALMQALVYGCLRLLPRLQAVLKQLLKTPLKAKDQDLQSLLYVGLYQQLEMRIPDHAAIGATVDVCRELKKPWATRLSNGVLRHFQRNRDALLATALQQDSASYAHPDWWLQAFAQDWPSHWQMIAEANNQAAPMSLRVNLRYHSRQTYAECLAQQGIACQAHPHTQAGLLLEHAVDVQQLPGFAQGWVSVQDNAAQLAAELLQPQAGQRVLDACAAPGGKTAHLLEMQPEIELWALDESASRLQSLRDNLARLNLSATVCCENAQNTAKWWDKQGFERILLDVPCSASGVIRRHPDIKYLRRQDDLAVLAQRQAQLLNAIWPLLKPQGLLLYATCSVFAQENDQPVAAFLRQQPDAQALPLDVNWGQAKAVGRQILPGEEQMDGFYYALLHKTKCSQRSVSDN